MRKAYVFLATTTILFYLWISMAVVYSLEEESLAKISPYTVQARVANKEPIGIYATPISQLRYEPLVDVQIRNFGEAQGDVSIRGGIFENTGFKLGGSNLFDPQTGHYFAEIPVDPRMLTIPTIATGVDNAFLGFNSTVGTIDYGWAPLTTGGETGIAFGDHDFNYQRFILGQVIDERFLGKQIGLEFSYARSESDGTRRFSDHDFNRYAACVQLFDETSQTDLFVGYQSKFFGHLSLYTPFNVAETENLKTSLFLINHKQNYGEGSFIELGAYYRTHTDDYEYDRSNPGVFNPFEHDTRVTSLSFQGRHLFSGITLNYSGQVLGDSINTTNLDNGPFRSRTYYKFTLLPEKSYALNGSDLLTFRSGISFDDTNRDGSAVSPLFEIALDSPVKWGNNRYYFEYSKASQVPGYTILGASRSAGLFRGNPDASREKSHNIELGLELTRPFWQAHFALFYRIDDDLQDWTFSEGSTNARTANPVDIDTFGIETTFFASYRALDFILGYTFLHKEEEYGIADVDASFYALNFAKHRWTVAIIWEISEQLELRSDNEFRIQEENTLRTSGDEAVLSSIALSWYPPIGYDLEITFAVDNLFNSNFQEIPSVPASRRQVSLGATYRW